MTPYLLKRVNELTAGASLTANIALIKNNAAAGNNMSVLKSSNSTPPEGAAGAAEEENIPSLLVDDKDPRRKNVDSGKVAIIMSTDSHSAFREKWSGTSKERRQWAASTLAMDKQMNAN